MKSRPLTTLNLSPIFDFFQLRVSFHYLNPRMIYSCLVPQNLSRHSIPSTCFPSPTFSFLRRHLCDCTPVHVSRMTPLILQCLMTPLIPTVAARVSNRSETCVKSDFRPEFCFFVGHEAKLFTGAPSDEGKRHGPYVPANAPAVKAVFKPKPELPTP